MKKREGGREGDTMRKYQSKRSKTETTLKSHTAKPGPVMLAHSPRLVLHADPWSCKLDSEDNTNLSVPVLCY